MAFSTDVRRELAKAACEKKCCALAELTGAFLASGGLSFKGFGRYGLALEVDSLETAQRYLSLCRRFLHVSCSLATVDTSRLGGLRRYSVLPPDADIPSMLKTLRLLDKNQPFGIRSTPVKQMLADECCRRAFLRGAFLACGSTNDPHKAYHMEFAVGDEGMADCINGVLHDFGLPARLAERKSRLVVYLKDGEHMATLLALMGAHKAMMELENVRIVKDIRNGVNRQSNCDNANVDKTVAAAQRQLSIIETINKKMGIDNLPDALGEIAELRMRYPDASLTELGDMCTPAIGKSGVNARMRKLEALAEELVND